MVELGGAGTVCHMGGRVGFTLCSRYDGHDTSALWFPAYAERACATVVASSYSAWRFPRPVVSRLSRNDGEGCSE